MCLEESAEITYSGNLPLKSAKHRQRNMEEMIRSFENYSPNKEKCKIQKASTFLNTREFYKKRGVIIIAFENGIFPLSCQYPSSMDDWKDDELDTLELMSKKKESSNSFSSPSYQHKKVAKNN